MTIPFVAVLTLFFLHTQQVSATLCLLSASGSISVPSGMLHEGGRLGGPPTWPPRSLSFSWSSRRGHGCELVLPPRPRPCAVDSASADLVLPLGCLQTSQLYLVQTERFVSPSSPQPRASPVEVSTSVGESSPFCFHTLRGHPHFSPPLTALVLVMRFKTCSS